MTKQGKYGQAWKSPFMDVDLPSGNVCSVRRPGVQGLIKAGVLESMDVLTGLVQQVTIPKAEGKVEVSPQKMMEDPKAITRMIDILDDIVLYVVDQPKVLDKYETYPSGHPTKAGERVRRNEDGEEDPKGNLVTIKDSARRVWSEESGEDIFLYVDEVDMEDKMFLMNFVVGGSRDFATFRTASEEALGGVPDSEATQPTTE